MNDSDHGGIVACICAALTVASLSWAVAWYNAVTTQSMMENGYTEQWIEGHGTIWVRSIPPVIKLQAEASKP